MRKELLRDLQSRIERREKRRKLFTYYPEEGPYRRELYVKHMQFFAGGAQHRERLMMAANRVGKTEGIGGYELTLHLTGLYPAWWEGRRFTHPVDAWAAGKTNTTTRDIIQQKLFGSVIWQDGKKVTEGTGLIPGDLVSDLSWKQGIQDLLDSCSVKHTSGGYSQLGLRSYEQGRGAFEGVEKHVIWLDEEPQLEVYTECLVRTMTVDGLIMITFTPLEGMSDVVLSFMEDGKLPDSV